MPDGSFHEYSLPAMTGKSDLYRSCGDWEGTDNEVRAVAGATLVDMASEGQTFLEAAVMFSGTVAMSSVMVALYAW